MMDQSGAYFNNNNIGQPPLSNMMITPGNNASPMYLPNGAPGYYSPNPSPQFMPSLPIMAGNNVQQQNPPNYTYNIGGATAPVYNAQIPQQFPSVSMYNTPQLQQQPAPKGQCHYLSSVNGKICVNQEAAIKHGSQTRPLKSNVAPSVQKQAQMTNLTTPKIDKPAHQFQTRRELTLQRQIDLSKASEEIGIPFDNGRNSLSCSQLGAITKKVTSSFNPHPSNNSVPVTQLSRKLKNETLRISTVKRT